MSVTLFVKVHEKTFIFNFNKHEKISLYELSLHAWDKYFEYMRYKNNIFELDLSGNPFKLIGKRNFLRCHRILINSKSYNYRELDTIIDVSDYNEKTFVINSYFCGEDKFLNRNDIDKILKVDFSKFDN